MKEQINVVFIGHVDHGKSTLVGHMLTKSGAIDQHTIDKYEKEGVACQKKGSFKYAFVMDELKEERERGVTIEAAHKKFETKKNEIVIIDAPGHRDFVKNMIQGTSEADAAILVVAAGEGIMAQTMEHAVLAKTMGVGQLLVAVNKMDTVDFSKDAFDELCVEIRAMLKKYFWDVSKVDIVPVSAFHGDNIADKSSNMKWWRGATFLEHLDNLKSTQKDLSKPFRMPIDSILKITGVGTVVCGVIQSGRVRVGDSMTIAPLGMISEVKSIESYKKDVREAEVGDDVGIALKGVDRAKIKRGYVMGNTETPPISVKEFSGRIMIIKHPKGISEGYTPIIHAHTLQMPCLFEKFIVKLDIMGNAIGKNPSFLINDESAMVKIKPMRTIVLEESQGVLKLSRFAIRDMGMTVGAGIVVKITAIQCPKCGKSAFRTGDVFICDNDKCDNNKNSVKLDIYGRKL